MCVHIDTHESIESMISYGATQFYITIFPYTVSAVNISFIFYLHTTQTLRYTRIYTRTKTSIVNQKDGLSYLSSKIMIVFKRMHYNNLLNMSYKNRFVRRHSINMSRCFCKLSVHC